MMALTRREFFQGIKEEIERDTTVYLLTADIGYSYMDELLTLYPDRVINIGIAETTMIGIAKGLSDNGKRVFCFTMSPFLILRPLELIRLVSLSDADITLVGYQTAGKTAGPSHIIGDTDRRVLQAIGVDECPYGDEMKPSKRIRYVRLAA